MSNEFKGLRYSSIALPHVPVGHPDYVWRGHADTDVQRTWRTYGWNPVHPTTDTAEPRATHRAPTARLRKVRG